MIGDIPYGNPEPVPTQGDKIEKISANLRHGRDTCPELEMRTIRELSWKDAALDIACYI